MCRGLVHLSAKMEWNGECDSVGEASTQTGVAVNVTDGSGEPPEREKIILETAPGPRDSVCVRGTVCT